MKIMDIISEEKKKNCGCGKDPCETYGTKNEAYDPEYGHDSFSHVVKHKDDNGKAFWAVYNHDGKIVKVFYSEKSASKYAEKNHDALMKNKIKADEAYGMRDGDMMGISNASRRKQQSNIINQTKRMNNRTADANREVQIATQAQQRRVNRLSRKVATGIPQRAVAVPQQQQAPQGQG